MLKKLTGKGGLLWSVGIIVCLAALLIGIVTAAIRPYYARAALPDVGSIAAEVGTDIVDGGSTAVLNALAPSGDAGTDYVNLLLFVTDSVTSGMSGTLPSVQILPGADGVLPAAELSTASVVYHDGSKISVPTAVSVMLPRILVLCVGSDGLADVSNDAFKSSYTKLLTELRSVSPQTQIICCSIPPVAAGYKGADRLGNEKIGKANGWLREICTDTGVFYADTASAVSGVGAVLDPAYAAEDGKTLNADGCAKLVEYLRTHALAVN